jgi:hypothetical protein
VKGDFSIAYRCLAADTVLPDEPVQRRIQLRTQSKE